MTTDSLPILEQAFRRECRSLAQYLGESWPWTRRKHGAAQDLLRAIIDDERRWAARLADLIEQAGGVPAPGNYPTEFTELHYLALGFMLDRLVRFIDAAVVRLERDRAAGIDNPAARALFEEMIERKRGQSEALHRLAAARVVPAALG
jgi:hypothetical protein